MRLEAFVPRAGRAYSRERNYDRGPGRHTAVSTLSPWIRHRLILEQEVVAAVLAHHSLSAAEKFVQEVFWRTYWKGWLELRPGVWDDYRVRVTELVDELDRDAGLHDRWRAATGGTTGVDCFDAWSQELAQTGYLHNHARMWFASIWIFTLELPWELGADFFLRHLLDGDPASNTLSWRWVAGLQTRGKTYLARRANIARFTEGRFDPAGTLSTTAAALPSGPMPLPVAPPEPALPGRGLRSGLLVTEEDLGPGLSRRDYAAADRVAVLTATGRRSPFGVSPRVQAFAEGAVDDTLRRGGLTAAVRVDHANTNDSVGRIVAWAVDRRLEQLVTPYVPAGPTAEATAELAEALAAKAIKLVPVLRDWDRRAWPHATHGFFPFRKQIPALIRGIGSAASGAQAVTR